MSSSHSGLPAPVTGIAFAGLAGVGGLLLRRRAFDFATS
jgi:MYXO-CTERM domain-containing protein